MKSIMLCCSCCHRHKCPAVEAETEMDSLYNVTKCKYYGEKEMNNVATPFEKILGTWIEPKDNTELPVEEKHSVTEPEIDDDENCNHVPGRRCED